jgi:cell wall-associated NlpC family hydrolase
LNFILSQQTQYRWGGAADEKQGLDCSGFIFLAARRAGMPVRRTTSRGMAEGDGGWTGVGLSREASNRLDLCFWTFSGRRPHGHVGVLYRDREHVTHSTARRGVTIDRVEGRLAEKLSRIIRLTVGEKQ